MQAKIFISYSRRNREFTEGLFNALKARGYDPWVDWDDIPFSVDWWEEIKEAINNHDVVIIVVSNASMTSRVVSQEIKYARDNNKRLIPVIAEQVDIKYVVGELYDQPYEMVARDNWKYIRTLNWIYFYRDEDDFAERINGIITAIEVDYDYLREHTRILNRAQEWNDNDRGRGFLLMAEELAEAEKWLARAQEQRRMPMPTSLHREYIDTSREAEDDQEAQIEAMRRQTRVLRSATIVLILTAAVVGVFVVFTLQTQQRLTENVTADRDRIQTESAVSLAAQGTIEAQIQEQSTQAAQTQQAIRAESTQAFATQQILVSEIEFARQQSESLRLASEAENALENGDPNLLAIPLALVAHRVVDSDQGTPPLRVGRILASASYQPGLVRFFNPAAQGTTPAHDNEISAVMFNADGTMLVSASLDRTVRVWDVETGGLVRVLEGHTARVTSATITEDGAFVASGDADGSIIVWEVETGEILWRTDDAHTNRVTDLAFSPDGAQLVSTSADTFVNVWRAADGAFIRTQGIHGAHVTRVAYNPDGSAFITGDVNGRILVWNSDNGFFQRDEARHTGAITDIAYTADGSTVITSSQDGRFIVWRDFDQQQRQINDQLRGTVVNSVGFINPDIALIGTGDGALLVWRLATPETEDGEIRRLVVPGQPVGVSAAALTSGGQFAAAAYGSNQIALWDTRHGANLDRLKLVNFPVTDAVVAADDTVAFRYLDPEGTFVMWQPEADFTTQTRADLNVSSAVLHPDGQTIFAQLTPTEPIPATEEASPQAVAAGNVGTLVRMNLADGSIVTNYNALDVSVAGTVFSPDGTLALSIASGGATSGLSGSLGASGSGRIIWDVETGEMRQMLVSPPLDLTEETATVAFTQDNTRLAIVSNRQGLNVLDTTTGEIVETFDRERDVTAVTFATNNTLVVGYNDGGLALFKTDDTDWRDLRAHTGAIRSLATSPNGLYVLSGGADGTAVMWDIAKAEPVRDFQTDTNGVSGVAFHPAGNRFVTRSIDGSVNVWRFDSDADLIEWVREDRFITPFSASDCRTFQIPDPCGV